MFGIERAVRFFDGSGPPIRRFHGVAAAPICQLPAEGMVGTIPSGARRTSSSSSQAPSSSHCGLSAILRNWAIVSAGSERVAAAD